MKNRRLPAASLTRRRTCFPPSRYNSSVVLRYGQQGAKVQVQKLALVPGALATDVLMARSGIGCDFDKIYLHEPHVGWVMLWRERFNGLLGKTRSPGRDAVACIPLDPSID